ncbi:Uncharacterised protein [Yersinia frederiksenii]|nr:Uncharacterised protein [Yersinia frederiksenii]CND19376.1 Uncharacterised protein [Yersinia frederiksenii]
MVAVQIQCPANLSNIIRAGAEYIVRTRFKGAVIDVSSTRVAAGHSQRQGVGAILCQATCTGEIELHQIIGAALEN